MIELNTGVPGSGKTLGMVQRLSKLQSRWESHAEESRPVFVLGIPDLALPHSPVPLKSEQVTKAGAPMLVPDWDLMPDGSLVIIDEAQGCFPPRSSLITAPQHVSWLNTHRHRGFDIWITTQHPKLIDGTVRALVGKHQHYRRMFGGSRAVVYEWDCCSDSLSGLKNAVKTYYPYPKNVFKFYKSAEIHTKQRFKIPMWLGIPFVGIALGIFAVPKAYSTLSKSMNGQAVSESLKSQNQFPVSPLPVVASSSSPSQYQTPISSVLEVVESHKISACLANSKKCQCYTFQSVPLDMSDSDCRKNAAQLSDKFRLDLPEKNNNWKSSADNQLFSSAQ